MATVAASLLVGIAVSGYFAIEANKGPNSALRLASEKDKLAQEKTKLAQEKTKLAADEIAARVAAVEAETKERVARQEAQTQRRLAKQRLTRSEWLLYAGQIGRAQLEWNDANVAAAWESLDACRWEHDYLFTLFNSNQQTLRGHTQSVNSVAFSPDGRWIVSGSFDKTLKVWDAESGQEMFTLKGNTGGISGVAFSPDGRRIVSGSWDETLKVWDASKSAPKPKVEQ